MIDWLCFQQEGRLDEEVEHVEERRIDEDV